MSEHMQQRSNEWFAARRGRLTASNVGAAVGLCSWVSRQKALDRACGRDEFKGNAATEHGQTNEQNAIIEYQTQTGNMVEPTGLWIHPDNWWIAGSPDGLVDTDGAVEVKCPFYNKTPHTTVPTYYYAQINCQLECAQREWCDFVSWTPDSCTVTRVTRDSDLFDFLLPFYGQFFSQVQRLDPKVAPMQKDVRERITARVEASMSKHVDYTYYNFPQPKRQKVQFSDHVIENYYGMPTKSVDTASTGEDSHSAVDRHVHCHTDALVSA